MKPKRDFTSKRHLDCGEAIAWPVSMSFLTRKICQLSYLFSCPSGGRSRQVESAP